MNLAQFIAKKTGRGRRFALRVLEEKLVSLNGSKVLSGKEKVGKFDLIELGTEILQNITPRYILLNKPAGILSATKDHEHKTAIDLITTPWANELHIAGRLDRSSTGLVILTNDSEFSESLTKPENKIAKTYLVSTDQNISLDVITVFQQGMYFEKEGRHTSPASVKILAEKECELTIYEGMHHQIKRMFLRHGIRVVSLYRKTIGIYSTDGLGEGEWREFSPEK